MLVRIVRMYFKEDSLASFLEIFELNREAIGKFNGCRSVELMKDSDDSLCYCTLSHWENPDDLEKYRKSELFGEVWKQVKPLFTKKAEAFSLLSCPPAV